VDAPRPRFAPVTRTTCRSPPAVRLGAVAARRSASPNRAARLPLGRQRPSATRSNGARSLATLRRRRCANPLPTVPRVALAAPGARKHGGACVRPSTVMFLGHTPPAPRHSCCRATRRVSGPARARRAAPRPSCSVQGPGADDGGEESCSRSRKSREILYMPRAVE